MKISKQVKHIIQYQSGQRMIINGQVMETQPQPFSTFACPFCGRTLIQLQGEIPSTQMSAAVEELQKEFQQFTYCPNCGEKLDWDICSVIDVEPIEVKTEDL